MTQNDAARILAKVKLGLPLTDRERAFYVLYLSPKKTN